MHNSNSNNFLKIIFSSAFSGYLLKGFQLVISLITLPIIISGLGKVQYGILILIGQTIGFIALSDMGVLNSIGRFVSKYKTDGSSENTRLLISTSFLLLSAIAVLIFFITVLISYWIPLWLNIEPQYHTVTRIIFIINGIFLALLFPVRIGQGILAGFQKYPIQNIIGIVTVSSQLVGILILASIKRIGLIELTLLTSVSTLLSQAITIFIANRSIKLFPVKLMFFSKKIAKDIISLGSSSFLITLSGLLIGQGLTIGIGIILNTAAAGIYGVVIMIITNISFLLTKMGQPLVTMASELEAKNDKAGLVKLTSFVMNISFTISSLITIILAFYSNSLLNLLIKDNWTQVDYQLASTAIVLMSLCITIGIPQFISRAVLQGVGMHWQASLGKIIASFISFCVGILLMYLGFDILGAALGWGLVWVLQAIFYFPKIISRYFNQTIKTMFINSYLPGLFVTMFNLPFAYFLFKSINPSNLIGSLIGVVSLVITTALLFLVYHLKIRKDYTIPKKFIPVFLQGYF